MEKNLTELVFILDRSGSMAGLESDTIGGFNAMIAKQKRQPGRAFVSTILFDDESLVLHDRVELQQIPPMTEKDYEVRGCTALLDAVGNAIRHISNIHKYARAEDRPEKTLFVITTDGMENASRKFTYQRLKALIRRQREEFGWEFLFLGANIDAAAEAARFGIDRDHAADYHADSTGTGVVYDTLGDAVCQVRCCAAPLSADWKKKVEADYAQRK